MEAVRVLVPVQVNDDIYCPLRLVLLPASVVALGERHCRVRLRQLMADDGTEVHCTVGMGQLVAGEKQVCGEKDSLENLKMKLAHQAHELAADEYSIDRLCRSFVCPALKPMSTEEWSKLSTSSVTYLNIFDKAVGQAFCACAV
eukprot:jgi/Tetstr1/426559/TSEL_001635.t1